MNEYVNKLFDNPELIEHSVDIIDHKETLANLAMNQDVVEFGVRCGFSSVCFLKTCKSLTSYDIDFTDQAKQLKKECPSWTFNHKSSLEVQIPECDVLFIDSEHTYKQLTAELNMHHHKVKKYIAMHDTNMPELSNAMFEFIENTNWTIHYKTDSCNGLTVLINS